MRTALLAAAACLSLAGCGAVAENRIETALTDAGLSRPVSSCIAERMVDKLSIAQLRSISRLKDKAGERPKEMGLPAFLLAHRSDLDPEVYAVIARAGVGCALST
ncbi:hypothetical protein E2493_04635 [Sphingomonas parva]|uniref:Lipoprotein n=1 Tax=Sphingomonas parva TaxID=2555898 RepID=A0A4Y8ZVX0_9SPHN|nr:hypothetical protein [Sphingomonas parva]TFI59482.1 hypothetical protein E2493_04635 [Sphingomonas parva]